MNTNTSSTVQDSRDALIASLNRIVTDAEAMLANAQHGGSEQFAAARAKFETQLGAAKEQLAQFDEAARRNLKRAGEAAEQAIHDRPYASMGVAAGVGVLLGMLIARR